MKYTRESTGMSILPFIKTPDRFAGWFEDIKDATMKETFFKERAFMVERQLCPCGSGLKHEDCCPDIAKQSVLAELYLKLKMLDDALLGAQKAQNVQSICQAGCNYCCSDYFYISMPEYFLLKHRLKKIGLFDSVRKSGTEQYKKLSVDFPAEFRRLERKECSIDSIWDDKKYLSRFQLCPVNLDGTCAAYAERSTICRFYGTVFAPQSFCPKILSKSRILFKKAYSRKKLQKMCVSFQYDKNLLMENLDCFRIGNQHVYVRPYPLIYWLAKDAEYIPLYQSALTQTPQNFARFVQMNT